MVSFERERGGGIGKFRERERVKNYGKEKK